MSKYEWKPYIDGCNYINVNDMDAVLNYFETSTNPITLYCPGSGSWLETFYNKEDYLERQNAWNTGGETLTKYIQKHWN